MTYTAGTTGKPKGVVLSNRNIIETAKASSEFDHLRADDEVLAYLPMAWVGDFIFSIGQAYWCGFCVNCPESPTTMYENLHEIGPTYFFAPPRVFENQLTTVMIRMEDAGPLKQRIFRHFMAHARKAGPAILDGLDALEAIAEFGSLAAWLQPWHLPGTGLRALRRLDLEAVLRQFLGHHLAQRVDALLPIRWETPAGTSRRIQYATDGDPLLALPLQEMFGEARGPVLADGRVPVLLHLLSPGYKPMQVTQDLASFWKTTYFEVRKELRGRYKKHHWPEDPLAAQATRRAN